MSDTNAVKEYNDVLVLARGLVSKTLQETADGFQVSDLVPIISTNWAQAMAAYDQANQIPIAWRDNTEECMLLTIDFAVDMAMDLLKIPGTQNPPEFKETSELLAAVSGITTSVIAALPGGIQMPEVLPIVFDNFNKIMVGVDGINKIAVEAKADLRAFIKLVAVSAITLAFKVKEAMTAPKA